MLVSFSEACPHLQAFKQTYDRSDGMRKELRDVIRQQQEELQKHIDYLNSIRNYVS